MNSFITGLAMPARHSEWEAPKLYKEEWINTLSGENVDIEDNDGVPASS
ncbi:hypothetical protein [Polluticoccus soli]|nr:hypothetical protein [Flavipsychrobacter sp. JY13-12]